MHKLDYRSPIPKRRRRRMEFDPFLREGLPWIVIVGLLALVIWFASLKTTESPDAASLRRFEEDPQHRVTETRPLYTPMPSGPADSRR